MDEILKQIHYYAQQLKGINMWQAAGDYDYISSFLDSPRWNDGEYYGVVPRGEETVDEYSHNCPIPFTANRCLVSRCYDNNKALEILNKLSDIFNTLKSDVSGDGLAAINAYIENTNLYIELLGGEPVPPGPVKEPILYRFFDNKPTEYIYGDSLIITLDKAKPIDHGEIHVLDVSPSVLSKGKPIDHGAVEVITPEIMPMMAARMIDHGAVSVLDVELDRIVEPTDVEQCCYGIMSTDFVSTDLTPFDESELTLMESTSIQQSYGEFIDDAVPLFVITHNDIMESSGIQQPYGEFINDTVSVFAITQNDIMESDGVQQSYGEFTDDGMLSFVIMQNDIMETWEPPALPTVSSESWVNFTARMEDRYKNIAANEQIDVHVGSSFDAVPYDSSLVYAISKIYYNTVVIGHGELQCVDNSGVLAVKNVTSSTIRADGGNYQTCDSTDATVITVYDSSNNPYNAFKYTSDGTDYYYVLDGTQTDWTDDLESIGYRLWNLKVYGQYGNTFSLNNENNFMFVFDEASNSYKMLEGGTSSTVWDIVSIIDINGNEVSKESDYIWWINSSNIYYKASPTRSVVVAYALLIVKPPIS
jgi:hypothetical protein